VVPAPPPSLQGCRAPASLGSVWGGCRRCRRGGAYLKLNVTIQPAAVSGQPRPVHASPCPRAPTRPGADSQSAPRAGAGRAPARPLPIGPASAPQADQAGPAGQAGPPQGGERRRPALGTPPDHATPKRVKTKKRELRGSGQVCRMAGEGARRAGNVPVRRIRCEWAPTPTEGPCEGICRGVAVEGPVGGVGGCEWAAVWLWIISSLNRESRGRVRWVSGGLA
jgi:hypothetical protein